MTCQRCGWTYPADLVLPFQGTHAHYARVCGICALELKNQIHGTRDTEFGGTMAEHMRRYALAWRQKNPQLAPGADVTC